jgi:hypothetical protein
VEAPLIPVCKEPVPKGGGLLFRIFCTGLISGTNGPLEPVLMSIFQLVLVEVSEASDQILICFADELPPPCLQDVADIGEGRLVAANSKKQQ